MKRTDYIIIAALIMIVLLLSYLIATSRYQEPVPYQMRIAEESTTATLAASLSAGETSYAASEEMFAEFGKRDLFRTIVPKPTPQPTRAPTPIPPPNLDHAVRTWKLQGANGNQASFRDTRTNSEFTIELGKTRVISYRGRELEVKVAEINMQEYSVTLTFQNQRIVKKMFE